MPPRITRSNENHTCCNTRVNSFVCHANWPDKLPARMVRSYLIRNARKIGREREVVNTPMKIRKDWKLSLGRCVLCSLGNVIYKYNPNKWTKFSLSWLILICYTVIFSVCMTQNIIAPREDIGSLHFRNISWRGVALMNFPGNVFLCSPQLIPA